MNTVKTTKEKIETIKNLDNQKGSAIVIAVFVLALVSVFVALALTRTATEAAAVGNETAEGRAFYAAQGSLEMMTRNFNKVFEVKLNPKNTDFDSVRNGTVPLLEPRFDFVQTVNQTSLSRTETIPGGRFAGLHAQRDNWQLTTTATDQNTGVQVMLTRNILNNRIPIFQFGIFYNDNLEFHPGARFDFGGRVHSNGSLFLLAKSPGLYFSSRISAVGEIVTDVQRNGKAWNIHSDDEVFINNASNTPVQLTSTMGSVQSTGSGTPIFQDNSEANKKLYDADMPVQYTSSAWKSTHEAKFDGNLKAREPSLDLPLKIASARTNNVLDYVELIKRGKDKGSLTANSVAVTDLNKDSEVTTSERYFNKPGIRITLANSKAKLPGCATVNGTTAIAGHCGVRLDGASTKPAANAVWDDEDSSDNSRGYKPLQMADGYQATRLNGERFRTGAGPVWIKIELVNKNATTNAIETSDVTEDILSLGVTEIAPFSSLLKNTTGGSYENTTALRTDKTDSRSIIKLQRFAIPGVTMESSEMSFLNLGGTDYNVVNPDNRTVSILGALGSWTAADNIVDSDEADHYHTTVKPILGVAGVERRLVPFPIKMFDSREGIYNMDLTFATLYGTSIPTAGVMSLIDIDVQNFRRFLGGEFDEEMPTSTDYYGKKSHVLRNHPTDATQNDVPEDSGWVVYVSDRRGDHDFDGEYDMEDIYGGNDGTKQNGEDVNNSGSLNTDYTDEAVKYNCPGSSNSCDAEIQPGVAASRDHKYYRRGVRLINGTVLPGKYDWAVPGNTQGFTVASENGVYVYGNYNATGISSVGTPTKSDKYLPQGKVVVNGVVKIAESGIGANHIPASIAADAVTILSNYVDANNGWSDSKSFASPFAIASNKRRATETFVRFAMLSGDARSATEGDPSQGSTNERRMGGGVHNFKRFLEDWGGVRCNYAGSLINLYNARNNNGSYKAHSTVYGAPTRNWVFDSSFLDPTRLPPGTPYFQYIQTTGFQRTNN